MQNKDPLISIAMATYNGESFIYKQLESIFNQSYKNFELIISDDNSSDSTLSIIKLFMDKHKNISLFINKKENRGYVGNFQNALNQCNGELIALSDQDDIWHSDKLLLLQKEIGENSLIYSDANLTDANDNILTTSYTRSTKKYIYPKNIIDIILNNPITGCTMMFKRDLMEHSIPFPLKVPVHDQWIAIVAITHFKKIKYIDKQLINYRQHTNNQLGANYNNKNLFKKIKNVWTKRHSEKFLVQERKSLDLVNSILLNDNIIRNTSSTEFDDLVKLKKYYINLTNQENFFSILLTRIIMINKFTPQRSILTKLVGLISIFKVLLK